jgi:ABC-type nickel/cobalt efflux system permease component RcnA
MNYSTWIITLGLVNTLAIFSGFPPTTKKVIIVISTLLLILIGLILRAVERKQQKRLQEKKMAIEEAFSADLDEVADAVAHDTHTHVEKELEEITHEERSLHHYDNKTNS